MLEGGFVRVYRSILKWEWYDDANTMRVFLHLILTANYEDKQWHGITVRRGQRVCSYSVLAKELRISERNVRTAVKHLKMTGEVTHQPTSNYGLFTVLNYEKFQEVTPEQSGDRHPSDTRPTPDRHQWKKDKESNKAKKAKEEGQGSMSGAEKSPPDRKVFISLILNDKSFYPVYEDQIPHWKELYPAVNVEQELRNMAGWCEGNPRNRKTRPGIGKFITRWLQKTQDRGGNNGYGTAGAQRKEDHTPWV